MSIAALAVAEAPVSAQPQQSKLGKPPPKRQLTAKSDPVAMPEPR